MSGWSLLSGFIGALLVFVFTVVYTEIREARRRVRARMGYARLLDAAIEANQEALEEIQRNTAMSVEELALAVLARPPTDDVWKQVREPLAPLIEATHLRTLLEHYRLLNVLLDLKGRSTGSEDLGVRGVASDLVDEGPRLKHMLSGYANPSARKKWIGS